MSLGDFVLSGGELAAMALIDACVRLLPGVMGAPEALEEESFDAGAARVPALHAAGRMAGPRGARRCCFRAITSKIRRWRLRQAERDRPATRRPDLWAQLRRAGARQPGR